MKFSQTRKILNWLWKEQKDKNGCIETAIVNIDIFQ